MDNCKILAEKYLLTQNPLYAFNFPIALLVGIIFFGISQSYKWSNNSYINQILIPVVFFLMTMVIIDVISRLMISKKEKDMIVSQCVAIENFKEKNPKQNHERHKERNYKENFMSKLGSEEGSKPISERNSEEVKNHIIEETIRTQESIEMPGMDYTSFSPQPLENVVEVKAQCDEPSNCCNLCSGSNSNPCNLIAPIPGPQWLPQTAASVQNRLKNNDYSKAMC
jgi:hypothetical protein